MPIPQHQIDPKVFLTFETLEDAIVYRSKFGTGGWIYEVKSGESSLLAVICPPQMTQTQLTNHPFIACTSGVFHN